MTLAASASDFLVALIAAVLAVWFLRRRYLRRRRERQPFPPEWRALLRARLPLLAQLTPEQRGLHERRTQEFLHDVRFVGCNGFVVTDSMRVLIAGMACLLILRPEAHVFRGLHAVLVYPAAFWVRHQEPDELGLVDDAPQLRLGESWNGERVILSWQDVEAALAGDPVNVLVHEFAHQLDDENPGTLGAPRLADYTQWSKVMQAEFERLQRQPSPVLDDYGLEGPQEFFAVATEAYFQSGAELRRAHPKLYALLRDYYLIDTAELLVA
ncbi:MAG: zinc-dependent peptidase [Nevskia sp.]